MRRIVVAAAALVLAAPAWALYKVVGPDGQVTYTDRAPAAANPGNVAPFKPGHSAAAEPEMPFELRQATQRYPVTLYVSADCAPCDMARQLLLQRGVPFAERRISTEADAKALDALGAGRMMPGLSVGPQQLRGLNTQEWTSYLDAAGYPRDNRLPKGWKAPVALPLADPRPSTGAPATAEAAAEQPSPRRTAPVAPSAAPAPTTGLRF